MAGRYPGGGNDGLVAAAISKLTGNNVLSQQEYVEKYGELKVGRKYNLSMGHENSLHLSGMDTPRRFSVSESENVSRLFVRDTVDKIHSIVADLDMDTVRELKRKITEETDVSSYDQLLTYGGKVLADADKLSQYSLCREATILLGNMKITGGDGGNMGITVGRDREAWYLDQSELAPSWDCDFTHMQDDKLEYKRGGYNYNRPYGWRRFALNVLNRYDNGNNTWLGESGMRTQESPGEWAVSFHGEMEHEVMPGIGGLRYEKRVYSSPDIESAKFKVFDKKFQHNGTWYIAVFQARINPKKMVVRHDGCFGCGMEDIRRYGLCIKKAA